MVGAPPAPVVGVVNVAANSGSGAPVSVFVRFEAAPAPAGGVFASVVAGTAVDTVVDGVVDGVIEVAADGAVDVVVGAVPLSATVVSFDDGGWRKPASVVASPCVVATPPALDVALEFVPSVGMVVPCAAWVCKPDNASANSDAVIVTEPDFVVLVAALVPEDDSDAKCLEPAWALERAVAPLPEDDGLLAEAVAGVGVFVGNNDKNKLASASALAVELSVFFSEVEGNRRITGVVADPSCAASCRSADDRSIASEKRTPSDSPDVSPPEVAEVGSMRGAGVVLTARVDIGIVSMQRLNP